MPNAARKFLRFPTTKRPTGDESDEELITGIQADDQEAWAAFLNRYTDLIYHKAREYSKTSWQYQQREDEADEVVNLYLFIAAYLKQSMKSFQGKCKPKTWVLSIVGNRPRILKAYLLQKDPHRTDVRLPRVMATRSKTDQEIFKRLVWGFDIVYIAQDLNISEEQCRNVEDLLKENSPRVYDRIRANKVAKAPQISIHTSEDDGDSGLDLPDTKPNPEHTLLATEAQKRIQAALLQGIETLDQEERRMLILLFNEGLKPAEIVQLTKSDQYLGLPQTANLNRIYYLKDKALGKICEGLTNQFTPETVGKNARNMIAAVETYLTECGFPT